MRIRPTIFLLCACVLVILPGPSPAQWAQTSGPEGCWITALAVCGPYLFAGTRSHGVLRSADNGANLTEGSSGLPPDSAVYGLAAAGQDLFAGTDDGVFISPDHGRTWRAVNTGLPVDSKVYFLAVIGESVYAAAGDEIFVTFDRGASWQFRRKGLTGIHLSCLVALGEELFASTSDEPNSKWTWPAFSPAISLSVGGTGPYGRMGDVPFDFSGRLFVLAKGSDQWKNTGVRLSRPITCLARNGLELYLGTGRGLYLCQDPARSRKALKLQTPWTVSVRCLVMFHGCPVVGTDSGAFIVKKDGGKWTLVDTGLPRNVWVTSFAMTETDLFVGTRGHGVWRLPLAELKNKAGI